MNKEVKSCVAEGVGTFILTFFGIFIGSIG